jgi:hypothetical protein
MGPTVVNGSCALLRYREQNRRETLDMQNSFLNNLVMTPYDYDTTICREREQSSSLYEKVMGARAVRLALRFEIGD